MGLFSSEFEVVVKHSKEEAFDRFLSYVNKTKNLKLTQSNRCESIGYTRQTSLLSWPIDFFITFKEDGPNQTKLMVESASGTVDFGKAKGMINDIIKEIY